MSPDALMHFDITCDYARFLYPPMYVAIYIFMCVYVYVCAHISIQNAFDGGPQRHKHAYMGALNA